MLSADKQWDLIVMVLGAGVAYMLALPGSTQQNPLSLQSLLGKYNEIAQQNVISNNNTSMLSNYNKVHEKWPSTGVSQDVAAASVITGQYPLTEGITSDTVLSDVTKKWMAYKAPKDTDDTTDDPNKDTLLQDSVHVLRNNGQGSNDIKQYEAYLKVSTYSKIPGDENYLNLDPNKVHFVSFPWSAEFGESTAIGVYNATNFTQHVVGPKLTRPDGLDVYSFDITQIAENIPNGLSIYVCRNSFCSPNAGFGKDNTKQHKFKFNAVKNGDIFYSTDARTMVNNLNR